MNVIELEIVVCLVALEHVFQSSHIQHHRPVQQYLSLRFLLHIIHLVFLSAPLEQPEERNQIIK